MKQTIFLMGVLLPISAAAQPIHSRRANHQSDVRHQEESFPMVFIGEDGEGR